MNIRFTLVLIAMFALFTRAYGQFDPKNRKIPAPGTCLEAKSVKGRDLYGDWQAQFVAAGAKPAAEATVTFVPHPEAQGALSGRILRPSAAGANAAAVLAGDVGDGQFGIEESADGTAITGVWHGDVVAGSCGREIRGTWIDPGDDSERSFILRRKSGGW